ncbi:hypothetical protein JB92DRAFT_3177430 [Gautieria morchelliformis]|nr:hypothetical protein JB92DRAFT_3177430 [Gautieria morchelliformis]
MGEQDIWRIDQLMAMRMADEAWGVITAETISACWKHTKIVNPRALDGSPLHTNSPSLPHTTIVVVSVQMSIDLLQQAIDDLAKRKIGECNKLKAEEMVAMEGEMLTEKEWSDEDIVEQVIADVSPEEAMEVSDDEEHPPLMAPAQALQAVRELQRYALAHSGPEWDDAAQLLPKLTTV